MKINDDLQIKESDQPRKQIYYNCYQKNNRLKIRFNRFFMAAEMKSQVEQILNE